MSPNIKRNSSKKDKLGKRDPDPVILGLVIIVAIATIIFTTTNIASYYQSFNRPILTLLNSNGLAEDYPTQISNSTPIQFELQVIKPPGDGRNYGVLVYLSNGSNYNAEQNGPIGIEVGALSFPSGSGNLTLPVSFALSYRITNGNMTTTRIILNGEAIQVSTPLPYSLVGVFFKLTLSGGNGKEIPLNYAWVVLWLNLAVSG